MSAVNTASSSDVFRCSLWIARSCSSTVYARCSETFGREPEVLYGRPFAERAQHFPSFVSLQGCCTTAWAIFMRVLFLAFIASCSLSSFCAAGTDDIFAANTKLGRGINLGNALEAPEEGQWGVTLHAKYFQAIKQAGFASVRLPIKWSSHAATKPPYAIDAKFAERVDWAVEQATSNGLNIILDEHHYDEMDINPDENLPRLVAIWEQVAARYEDKPENVYFELLNEPHSQSIEAKWNTIIPALLAAVRKTNPTRPVIVGPTFWNGISALDELELPPDKNLILTVHFYEPKEFTHQEAYWMEGSDEWKGTQWRGTEEEQTAVRVSLDKAAEWAIQHDRPVLVGEFGAYEAADLDSRARWTRFVAREAEKRGFSWAYWEFCSGFGAYDPKADKWRSALKDALLGTPSPLSERTFSNEQK
jgi:endoglucanase